MRFNMNKYIRNPRFPFQVITSHKSNVVICTLFLTLERAIDTQEPSHKVMFFLPPSIKKMSLPSPLSFPFVPYSVLSYVVHPPLVFENHIIHIVRKDKVVHIAIIQLKMAVLLSRIIKPPSRRYSKCFDKEKTWKLRSPQKGVNSYPAKSRVAHLVYWLRYRMDDQGMEYKKICFYFQSHYYWFYLLYTGYL